MHFPIKTFICYAHEDHDTVEGLKKHLIQFEKTSLLEIWSDGKILPGERWDNTIKTKLKDADLILLFMSIDFINSDYIEKTELQAALQRHKESQVTIIPIIVRYCNWENYLDIGQFQALPAKGHPIHSIHFQFLDEVFYEIAEGVRRTAEELQARRILKLDLEASFAAEAKWKEDLAAKIYETKLAESKLEEEQKIKNQKKLKDLKDESEWQIAKRLDTLEAYENYLKSGYMIHRLFAEQRVKQLLIDESLRKLKFGPNGLETFTVQNREGEEKSNKMTVATTSILKNIIEDTLQKSMILIKGGNFEMGDIFGDGEPSEKPIHKLTLHDFFICKHLVTQTQWKAVMNGNPSFFKGDKLPVENISWEDIQLFIQKLNVTTGMTYRLPTEAEWEFAAKGGTLAKTYRYSGSDNAEDVAWFLKNSNTKTHNIESKMPNDLGLFDMSGNVGEWVADDWHPNYQGFPNDGLPWIDSPRNTNRVLRGGGWNCPSKDCRVSRRSFGELDYSGKQVGFRLALSHKP